MSEEMGIESLSALHLEENGVVDEEDPSPITSPSEPIMGQITSIVSVIPPEVLEKTHKLKRTWVLWYLSNNRALTWEERLRNVCSFSTVEHFWALYNHIRTPSLLPFQCDYNVFREGIKPMWEVAENKQGGRWLINVDKARHNDLLDIIWLEVLLAIIGEQFGDAGDEICGVVANIRNKGDKISIWTRNANNNEANQKIGEVLKQKLLAAPLTDRIPRPPFDALRYEFHDDLQTKQGSTVKPRLVIYPHD